MVEQFGGKRFHTDLGDLLLAQFRQHVTDTSHMAKGLEFDRVIVADVSTENYRTEMDRNLLYVACTRAMHRLDLVVVGEVSPWLPNPGFKI